MSKQKEITIHSISYVHDPDGAKKWFEIYIDIVKKQLLENVKKQLD
ncbi:hypothetical protein P9265_18670 [Schinkia azotoformans]|nr:hypothetical protein [Schinkia azotoformans]